MAAETQIREWKAAGEAVRRARRQRRDNRAGRSAEEIKPLRYETAKTASVCADCFAPLSPAASVTLVYRFIERIPGSRHHQAHDLRLPVPICLSCWLINIDDDEWRGFHLRERQNDHLDQASPPPQVRRLRCEGCGRPMRIETPEFRRLMLSHRCCCADCLHKAKLKRANERRRVRHEERSCVVCEKPFVPAQSTGKTCSNTCRQKLFRLRHAITRLPKPVAPARTDGGASQSGNCNP
jgi:hypothetical protein